MDDRLLGRLKNLLPLPAWCMACEGFITRSEDHNHRHPSWLCKRCEDKLPKWREGICLSCGHVHQMGDCNEDWALSLDSFTSAFGYLDPIKAWVSLLNSQNDLSIPP